MSKHAERTSFVKTLSRGQWAKIAAAVAAVGLIATAGVISRDFYQSSTATQIGRASCRERVYVLV